jgi:hypothetical protein
MPILMMALLALAIFLGLFFLFVGAMEAEHRQRDAEGKKSEKGKAAVQAAGRS